MSTKQGIIWITWLVTFLPFLIYAVASRAGVIVNEWQDILAFLFLMLIASLFPIKFFNTPFMPIHGVSLTLFLFFGLIIEALIIQFSYF